MGQDANALEAPNEYVKDIHWHSVVFILRSVLTSEILTQPPIIIGGFGVLFRLMHEHSSTAFTDFRRTLDMDLIFTKSGSFEMIMSELQGKLDEFKMGKMQILRTVESIGLRNKFGVEISVCFNPPNRILASDTVVDMDIYQSRDNGAVQFNQHAITGDRVILFPPEQIHVNIGSSELSITIPNVWDQLILKLDIISDINPAKTTFREKDLLDVLMLLQIIKAKSTEDLGKQLLDVVTRIYGPSGIQLLRKLIIGMKENSRWIERIRSDTQHGKYLISSTDLSDMLNSLNKLIADF